MAVKNNIEGDGWIPARFNFYRPHPRVTEDNSIIDPATGEIKHPPSMTKQAHREECDINNILKQYRQTGVIKHINAKAAQGSYQDLPDPVDFQEALNMVLRSEDSFATLPALVRDRFSNNPEQFLEFLADPANRLEAEKLGLIRPPAPAPEPIAVTIAGGEGGSPPSSSTPPAT